MAGSKKVSGERPFGLKDKLGYMFGDFGNDFTFIFASSFLMVFYTKVLGISGAIVGTLFLVARLIDAFADITMGRIIDTSKAGANGRFKPWIKRMSFPVVIMSVAMYLYFVKDWSGNAKIIYASVTYILWGICYSGINIPYGSMASVISEEAEERASLSTFRSMGSMLAGLIIGVGTPFFIYNKNAAGVSVVVPERFTVVAVIFGICALICYLIMYRNSFERIKVEDKPAQKGGSVKMFKALATNRALLAIIGAAMLLLLATLMCSAMNAYLYVDYFHSSAMLSLVSLVTMAAMFIIAPFATKICKVVGKKEAASAAVLFASVMYFLMYFLQIKNVYIFMALIFIATLGYGFFNMIIWAVITDIIDYQEVRTGSREDGTIYALYSFARKVGQAIAGGVGGYALTAIGYASNAATQTDSTLHGLYTVSTLVPGFCYLGVALILIIAFPLSRKIVLDNTAELKRRHEESR